MDDSKLGRFDHLVVVMFENRSFDNVLGYLYEPGEVPEFDGVTGTTWSNPVPPCINDGHDKVTVRMSGSTEADMSNPNPDPGEEYQHVNTQLFNIVCPPSNEFKCAGDMTAPWNNPAVRQEPTMQGFVRDYCSNYVSTAYQCKEVPKDPTLPTFEQYRVIMDCFGPQYLPVINTLAREFAVYDAWHCAVPSQTFCNRSFFHASSSSGFVVNEPYPRWITNDAVTIFNRLADAGVSWKVYYDETQLISLTALIHFPKLLPYWLSHFATMDTFYADVANGMLPAYAFVEPRMFYCHNDYHPPAPLFSGLPLGATSDARAGEFLLHQIYSAVRASASTTGSNALNTLLLVLFDEHGGTFDHVAPPPAVAPPGPPGECDFTFDRLGVRVPAIAISAYTQPNTVVHRPVHHGTVIRTLCEKYSLPYLNERDRSAADLSDAFNLEHGIREAKDWPVTVPRPVPPQMQTPDPSSAEFAQHPLNPLERHIVGLAMAVFREPGDIPTTLGAAYDLLARISHGAFGH